MYYRLTKNYNQNRLIPLNESPYKHVDDYKLPWFTSCYTYNEDHKKQFDATHSFAGINDNKTNKLWWDFDSEHNLNIALQDARSLYKRLLKDFRGITAKDIQVAFSGGKGFSIVIKTNTEFTRSEVERVCSKYAEGLSTFDTKVYDNQRIFRLPLTRHEKTGLYKTCLSEQQFLNLSIDEIRDIAIDPTDQEQYTKKEVYHWVPALLPLEPERKLKLVTPSTDIDWSNKPKWLSNCRWALQNGMFKEGERSNALLCLASTYKNQGLSQEIVRGMLLGVADIQAAKNNTDVFPENEIDNNIIKQIYSDSWKNGQYTCKDGSSWLHKYCSQLGENSCIKQNAVTLNTKGMHEHFEQFIKDVDKNILYTGIPSLDQKMKLMIGTTNGLVGAPGAGKTAISLQILNHNSKLGIPCIFFSYDMFLSAMYLKLLARHTDYKMDDLISIYKLDKTKRDKLKEILDTEYKNVHFCFRAGQTADEIKQTIKDVEDRFGQKIKLIIIDYNELIMSELSDMTASSSQTAQKIRQIANEQQICSLTLMQPTKDYFDPAQEIRYMGAAKGSGAVTQALTLLLGCSRPGFDPMNPHSDKFFSITGLKNRTGPLFSIDLGWKGSKGTFSDLSAEQREELIRVREIRDEKLKGDEW